MSARRINPITLLSIAAQGPQPSDPRVFSCGCMRDRQRDGYWWLCQYHDGYDDGIEAVQEAQDSEEGIRP